MGPSEQLTNLQRTFTYSFLGKPVPTTWEVFTGFPFRESVKKRFFGRFLPNVGGWGGWFPNKVQTPQNHPKSPQKSPFSTRISPFVLPNLTKTLGWVGKQIWFGTLGDIPKKSFFWAGFPILHCGKVVLCHLGRLRSSWFFLWNLVAEHDKCWACFHLYTV